MLQRVVVPDASALEVDGGGQVGEVDVGRNGTLVSDGGVFNNDFGFSDRGQLNVDAGMLDLGPGQSTFQRNVTLRSSTTTLGWRLAG